MLNTVKIKDNSIENDDIQEKENSVMLLRAAWTSNCTLGRSNRAYQCGQNEFRECWPELEGGGEG